MHVATYLYMNNVIHSCASYTKINCMKNNSLKIFDYENHPNYGIPNADFKIYYESCQGYLSITDFSQIKF